MNYFLRSKELEDILYELAVSADTAELLLRKEYPAEASSLWHHVRRAKKALENK